MADVDFDTETNSLYLLNNYYQSTASEGAEDFEFVEPMVFDMVIGFQVIQILTFKML